MSLTGCGKDRDTALQLAAVSAGLGPGDRPGCCSYNAEYATRPAAAVSDRAQERLRRPEVDQQRPEVRPNFNDRIRLQDHPTQTLPHR